MLIGSDGGGIGIDSIGIGIGMMLLIWRETTMYAGYASAFASRDETLPDDGQYI